MKKASTTTLLLWQRNTDHCYEIYVTKEESVNHHNPTFVAKKY